MDLQLQYEHIDWSDIVDAELSGDQETLRELRNRAAEIKQEKQTKQAPQSSPVSRTGRKAPRHQDSSLSAALPDLAEYPVVGQTTEDKENELTTLPFADLSSAGSESDLVNGASYAQMVTRNAKRTLGDRCLSPSEAPVKRLVTSDIMNTPTEFKHFFHDTSPTTCDTTPESGNIQGKAGLVQRRLFEIQTEEQASPTRQPKQPRERLTDGHRLAQRQKQMDFGKNTLGYERYIQMVPKWKRQKSNPVTPDKYNPCSTRSWQGQMRVWRRQLHRYDPAPKDTPPQFSLADAGLCNVTLDHED